MILVQIGAYRQTSFNFRVNLNTGKFVANVRQIYQVAKMNTQWSQIPNTKFVLNLHIVQISLCKFNFLSRGNRNNRIKALNQMRCFNRFTESGNFCGSRQLHRITAQSEASEQLHFKNYDEWHLSPLVEWTFVSPLKC